MAYACSHIPTVLLQLYKKQGNVFICVSVKVISVLYIRSVIVDLRQNCTICTSKMSGFLIFLRNRTHRTHSIIFFDHHTFVLSTIV